jgi:tetratricopeptide (TPR) repeat protein
MGLGALQNKDFETAREAFARCLSLREKKTLIPLNKEILTIAPYHCLGMALSGLGKVEAAIETLENGLLSHPGSHRTVQVDLAKIYYRKHNPVKALEILHSLTLDLPTDPEIWVLGGEVALSQPSFLEFALDWTSEAVKYCPANAQIQEQRGMALLFNQQCEGALECFLGLAKPASHNLAAIIMCQLVTGIELMPISLLEETSISSEFIKLYKQLLAFNSSNVLRVAMEETDRLASRLPSASRIVERIAKEVCDSPA